MSSVIMQHEQNTFVYNKLISLSFVGKFNVEGRYTREGMYG